MHKNVVIIGAGGHAKVIADIIEKSGDIVYGFLDDNLEKGTEIANNKQWQVIGNLEEISSLAKSNSDLEFIIAIGNNEIRKKIANQTPYIKYYTAVHPNTSIGIDVSIGEGTVIMANACINVSAKIGKHCIINTGAIVEHDNQIGDYVHISPNVILCGTVKVGEMSHIGAGSVVKNNINIINNCVIGAGTVVVKDINEKGTYIGTPARKLK